MQLTLSEHAASSFAGTRCVECHMPVLRDGHRSHAFADTRDEAKLRGALRVVAERSGATNASVTLRSQRVGHAFPTGDLFRRLVVEVEALGDDFAVVASARRELARHFTDATTPDGRRERKASGDDRVPADGERRVELELGDAARGRPLVWRVRYERVLHLNPRHEAEARVESSVLLASGELPENP